MKKVFIPKKLVKVFNKRTSREERVVIRVHSHSKFTGVFFNRSSDDDIKRATISEVFTDSDIELEILTAINDCICYLVSIGYAEVYLSTRYIRVCTVVSDLYVEVRYNYILFSKKD